MAEIDAKRLKEMLDRGVAIRNRYFNDEDDPVSALCERASEQAIQALESQLGFRLPNAYRLFLSLSNGWDFVDAHVSLMSCEDIGNAYKNNAFAQWYHDVWLEELEYPEHTLVIGTSDITPAKYLLVLPDPDDGNKKAEPKDTDWKIMYVDDDSEFYYDDFVDYLQQSEQTYRDLVDGESG
ncbi:SMI1/KNR4 family protein [Mesorhizobium amorphae]|uniref:SMI1/KNR4 family protein n=1 Tax=Mesorhizobium amorphae TaxID=71433 RepID=UPI00177EB6B6|nr:SMI1/KNR4 family protein [Mesorhizobium amorphae]